MTVADCLFDVARRKKCRLTNIKTMTYCARARCLLLFFFNALTHTCRLTEANYRTRKYIRIPWLPCQGLTITRVVIQYNQATLTLTVKEVVGSNRAMGCFRLFATCATYHTLGPLVVFGGIWYLW